MFVGVGFESDNDIFRRDAIMWRSGELYEYFF